MSKRKVEPKEANKKKAKQESQPDLPDESSDEEDAATPNPLAAAPSFDGQYVNKQRVLVFCSRGVTARARHLLEDVRKLVRSTLLMASLNGSSCRSCTFCLILALPWLFYLYSAASPQEGGETRHQGRPEDRQRDCRN